MLCKLISIRLRGMLGKTIAQNGKKATKIFVLIVFLCCAITFGALFYLLFSELAEVLHATPFAWFYFALAGLLSFGISFFFTAFAAKSELFEAKDNELLLSLPIHPRTILLSRLSILLGSEYLFSFLVMIPAGIAWSINAGIAFLPSYLLGCLCLPLLTAALTSLVGWLLALLSAKVQRKNLVTVVFSLAFMALYFYVYSNMQDYVNHILASYQQISQSMMGWGFLFHWFGQGIADGKLLLLFAVVGIAIFSFALSVWLFSHGFLHISSGNRTTTQKNTAELTYCATNVQWALLKRELKRFISCPVYLLNCGSGLILMPVAAVYLVIKADTALLFLSQFEFPDLTLAFLGAMLISAMASTCYITAPSISLEGKTLWILRSAPIDGKKILHSKLYLHLLLTTPIMLAVSAVAAYTLHASLTGWVILLLLPQLSNLLSAAFGLAINLRFPKLDWTSEAEPVKQSLPAFVSMTLMMLLPIVLIVGILLLDISNTLYILLSILLLTLLGVICLLWLEHKGTKRFNRL